MNIQKSIAPPLTVAALALALLVTTGFSTYAALIAEVSNPSAQAVSAGTLNVDLSDNGNGFGVSVSNLVPGDVVNRHVTLTNDGTVEGATISLEVTASGEASLITNGVMAVTTRAITLEINACSVAWTPATGVCSGDTTLLQAATPLGSFSTAIALSADSFAPAATRNLQFSISLPDQSETSINGVLPANTVQGKSVSITYTFVVLQRTATSVSQ